MRGGPTTVATVALASLAALALPQTAAGQPVEPVRPTAGPVAGGAEIGIGWSVLAGSGAISMSDGARARAAGVGGALELDAGWRALPALTVGAWGFGAQLSESAARPSTAGVYTAGAGIQGTWHFRPGAPDYDPWLLVGAGWRGQWLNFLSDGVTAEHGLEAVRVQAGVNLRVLPTVALSPVVGGSLSTYLTESAQSGPWRAISSSRWDAFVVAGVRATIDIPVVARPAATTARE
jgi:hypothetical protein